MGEEFRGRSITVINDLSNEERLYLFRKAKELKEALKSSDVSIIDSFRINNPNVGLYEVFLEDSTRTRESFKNAAKFHNIKVSSLNTDSSSINKGESYSDTFNTLTGYDNNLFVIRSKLEGVCRWLEISSAEYAERNNLPFPPSFINAGDGKHEHPTQELLDEFTLLEDNNWETDSIHIALVGDLFHGRTVHSKADGLTTFRSVAVDLIAPEELALPADYVRKMEGNGFSVREFSSIAEYLAQKNIADKWYFTRPQLERMGDRVLQKQHELRKAITFSEEFLELLKPDTRFYHPLPRNKLYPVLPAYLDNTPLNGWERQSANGMIVRIILLGMFSGHLGEDFTSNRSSRPSAAQEQFIEQIPIKPSAAEEIKEKHYSEGVRPISDGLVIDHICKGESSGEIRQHMTQIVSLLDLHGKGGEWVSTSKKNKDIFKGIIFRPDHEGLDTSDMKRLAAISPGCTINIIKNGAIQEKYRLHLPPKIYNLQGLSCSNPACISHPDHHELVPARFNRTAEGLLACEYCGKSHTFKEIWI
ncbi:MAG: aspartate carbamoyltransferase [Spirochaetes bacterium]|nr:aspartate carbamoyltransferase [Spirochaetota bacterium]